ncbi:hypothetical protein ANCCAN_00658 [Ancylostoma caninum]|uniref:Uncharacterized protein n=1 Tax=Ancylostoma caninum TaxID=29170 RepID=A0A368HCR5_ANCCA|nr:hypothetical protein ANCCAN_00658 [Ancylostoma caninum]
MLCSFLVAFAVVSFPTALLQAAGKPPGKCLGPVGITVERRNDLVTKINKRRTLMVKGLQRHGFRRSGALNVGENVLQMVSC